jgi:hypothetical protein
MVASGLSCQDVAILLLGPIRHGLACHHLGVILAHLCRVAISRRDLLRDNAASPTYDGICPGRLAPPPQDGKSGLSFSLFSYVFCPLTNLQPWMAGIFAACLALVGLNWLVFVLPETMKNVSNPVFGSNLLFVVLYGLVVFYYTSTMRADPGFVPRLNGVAEQKAVIDELISLWKFDENNFCVPCMIRTPLRSKHCKQCHRCVARHDQ